MKPAISDNRPEAPAQRARHDAKINLRLPATTRDLIDRAAAASGKTRTEFMIESARLHAVDVLIDQTLFQLDEEQWAAFNRVLDAPPPPNAELKRLFAKSAPWEG